MIRVLIADDHPIVREGLKQILSKSIDITVTGEAGSCREVLKMTSQNHFDVVLLDIKMPDRMGLDILDELKSKHPKLPVLILSTCPEEQYAIAAMRSGAFGYLEKKSAPKELILAIKQATQGMKYVSSSLAQRMAQYLEGDEKITLHEKLSSREYQVMCMLCSGKSSTKIADELLLSVKTISTHRTRILKKMGMENNIELARYAVNQGLIE
ncbi:response regulator transcription factor [bacterium]|nr:response regulator transcription factor [bacterium]